ncbi:centromeric, partial [Pristimantis euphronides]
MVMYCKSKIYAGVEEFSLEEIRAEIYMAKIRKKRAEELHAIALRRQEMEIKVEEMEKLLKGSCATNQKPVTAQSELSFKIYCDDENKSPEQAAMSRARPPQDAEVYAASLEPNIPALTLPSSEILSVAKDKLCCVESAPAQASSVPFPIFDETHGAESAVGFRRCVPSPKRPPLEPISGAFAGRFPLTDPMIDIEPLSEDAIVTGSDRNKTLFADLEDTCDFIRAAQFASTPFQKLKGDLEHGDASDLGRVPHSEKTAVCEEYYGEVVCPKKLSPILEASQEDTRSSVSSASTSSLSLFASKTLIIHEKLEVVSGVYDQHLEEASVFLPSTELQRNLLEAMPELLVSEAVIDEAGHIPAMKDREEVLLGNECYHLKREISVGENSRIYMGTQADCDMENMKGIALKVDSKPLSWHFYITQQLKERLGEAFKPHFVEQSSCYLFQDGCVTLYKDVCLLSFQDILQDDETVPEKVAVLLVYSLLRLVEKLHAAEIVHGDLRPETVLLDVGIFDFCSEPNNCFRLIDFSHSMDMRLCPTLTARAFPMAQTDFGLQILSSQVSAYQV